MSTKASRPVFQAGMEMGDGQSGLWHRVHGVFHWPLLPRRGLHSARMVVMDTRRAAA